MSEQGEGCGFVLEDTGQEQEIYRFPKLSVIRYLELSM